MLSLETAPSILSTLSDDCYYTSKSLGDDDDNRDAGVHVSAGARQLSILSSRPWVVSEGPLHL